MSNMNPNDQDSLNAALGDGTEDFIIVDEKRPLNRSLVALVIIAALGSTMIYLMYLRGRFNADLETPDQKQTSQEVSDFMASSDSSIRQMELLLAKTERAVASFQQNNASGQVPLEQLKSNPFEVGQEKKAGGGNITATSIVADPAQLARNAADKVKVTMIMFSGGNSSVTIGPRIYRVGDRLEVESVPFTIKAITQNSVTLQHPTGDYTLEVSKGL